MLLASSCSSGRGLEVWTGSFSSRATTSRSVNESSIIHSEYFIPEDAFLLKVLLVNLLGVRVFGELEFWMSGLKLLSLAGFILLGIVLDIGGNPLDDRIGFRYWRPPQRSHG